MRHEFGHNFGGNHFNAGQHRPYAAGYKKASSILGGNHINYYSNPRLNHPIRGFPIGRDGKNDMSRYITEQRFSIAKRGDESKPCYTCNLYSGQVLPSHCAVASGYILCQFYLSVNPFHKLKCCEAQARVRQGSARDGPQGERPQSLNPCLGLELTLKLLATQHHHHPPTTRTFHFIYLTNGQLGLRWARWR